MKLSVQKNEVLRHGKEPRAMKNLLNEELLHQKHRAGALDLARDLAMKMRGDAGNATRNDFTTLRDESTKKFRVFVVDRLGSDIDAPTRHGAVGAAQIGATTCCLGFHII